MCTLTWFVKKDGYELFFNRDERLSRKQAKLPNIQQANGISYISPTDEDAGGSWIATNDQGMTVCLLNHYQFEQIENYKQWKSRGAIVRHFASIRNLAEAEQCFKQLVFNDYRAFRMFILDVHGNNSLFVWDGHTERIERNVHKPKTSSSIDAANVKQTRKQLYSDLKLGQSKKTEDYLSYHSSHSPQPSKDSVCMHRDDAKTVSFSYINVANNQVSFSYADGSPCEAILSEPLNLKLNKLQTTSEVSTSTE